MIPSWTTVNIRGRLAIQARSLRLAIAFFFPKPHPFLPGGRILTPQTTFKPLQMKVIQAFQS
jgi:hypothetical protein